VGGRGVAREVRGATVEDVGGEGGAAALNDCFKFELCLNLNCV
jgi:hypothetical protein